MSQKVWDILLVQAPKLMTEYASPRIEKAALNIQDFGVPAYCGTMKISAAFFVHIECASNPLSLLVCNTYQKTDEEKFGRGITLS
jgi:hypothetical protein